MSKRQTRKKDGLVGKFFHTFIDGKISWQGVVTAEPAPGYFLVQLFDWFFGKPGDIEIIPISQMVGWTFYNDAEDWREAVIGRPNRTARRPGELRFWHRNVFGLARARILRCQPRLRPPRPARWPHGMRF